MKTFVRAVRLAFAYRWTLIAVATSALMVGFFWGANIGTVGPFVEVAIKGQSLHQWAHKEIAQSETKIAELESQIPALRQKARPGNEAAAELALAETRLKAEENHLTLMRALTPYIERYLPDDPFRTLLLIAAALLVGTLLKELFLMVNSVMVDRLSLLVSMDLRKKLYRQALRLELKAFGTEGSGDMMSRFTFDMEMIGRGMNSLFGKAVREPLKMIACLIGAAMVCWRLLVVSLILAPIIFFIVRRLAKVLKRANRRAMEEMSALYSLLEESFLGIKVVKAFTMERYERRRFHTQNKSYFLRSMKIARYEALAHPLTELSGMLTILLAVLCGAYLVLKGQTHLFGIPMTDRPLSLSALLLFYGLLSGVSDPARKLSEVFSRLQRASAASDRVYAVIDREVAVKDPPHPAALPRHRREIVFKNVSFAYVPERPVLENIDLAVRFGETIAIVGPNGCGKTTLVNLLPRFFDPVSGSVQIDGVELRDVRLRSLRQQMGLVTQETLLFNDTVLANIRYGCPQATREQVIEAAKQAHAHKFIEEKLSGGYETMVGTLGNKLSGGQRQRIALARAILRDPAILILDEATSQIDLEDEQLIHKVLEKFVRDRTTFIVTHRLSTLALADRVVVMNQGKIVDAGTHEELLRRCRLYSRLHEIQFRESA
ncbi:MAG: ABC transporter ATP-binding protein [Planctomycetia bacterium]|nr:ABC transporter ATP-binding protein [Planctomycetia bacterium]